MTPLSSERGNVTSNLVAIAVRFTCSQHSLVGGSLGVRRLRKLRLLRCMFDML
jgi:hypothetical protein